jgi:putative hydrolase of the HAD superfamily
MIKIKSAMNSTIKGVFFDYGGVVEELSPVDKTVHKGVDILGEILQKKGISITPDELGPKLQNGMERYQEWYSTHDFRELSNKEMWTTFFLRDLCKEPRQQALIEEMSEELSSIYEYYLYRRRPTQDIGMVLKTLFYSGYTLALISNTMSRTLIPERLKKFRIEKLFSNVVLSVNMGVRKPRKEIFEAALKSTRLDASSCVYVGDTVSRDVEGAKTTGFSAAVFIKSGLTEVKDRDYKGSAKPDFTLTRISDLFDILS